MKIIKNTWKEFTKEKKCPTCESLFEYDLTDVKIEQDSHFLPIILTAYIRCPVCNTKMIVDKVLYNGNDLLAMDGFNGEIIKKKNIIE